MYDLYKLVLIDCSVLDLQVQGKFKLGSALCNMKETWKHRPNLRCHLYGDDVLLLEDMELKTMCHVFDLLIPEINGGA